MTQPDSEPTETEKAEIIAREYRDQGQTPPQSAMPYINGGPFIFDIPETVEKIWGEGQDVIWPKGESCMIVGTAGVGKTTLSGQVLRGLIFGGQLLGFPIQAVQGKILYLAMDRPAQIARALARHFEPSERGAVEDKLVVWKGPPPYDLAQNPYMLAQMCREVGASVVIVDSLKDAAIGLSEDAVGAGYNRARQTALAEGIEVLELHHQVKRGPNGESPNTLADVYGSAWITNGAGSVILLSGQAGDSIVEFSHLKPVIEPVGPFKVLHDHHQGLSSVHHTADPLHMAEVAGDQGIEVKDYAKALFSKDKPTPNEIEKARRKLNDLVKKGLLDKGERPGFGGGSPTSVYVEKQSRTQSRTLFDQNSHGKENESRWVPQTA